MSQEISPSVGTFFVRYPDPLPFPESLHHVVTLTDALIGYAGTALHLKPDGTSWAPLPSVFEGTLFVSMRFHRGRHALSAIEEALVEMDTVIRRVEPGFVLSKLSPDGLPAPDPAWSTYTVVEMTSPIVERATDGVWSPALPVASATQIAFERALEALFALVRAYRTSEQVMLRPPTRERLGPGMVFGTRPARIEGGGAWHSSPTYMLSAMAVPVSRHLRADLSEEELQRVRGHLHAEVLEHPLVAVAELQADARAALEQDGDTRAAVLLFHSASEVLLDQALMLMQWEDGLAPEQAATVFERSLTDRIRSQYHDRLGGAWHMNTPTTVVSRWRANLVMVRHRVAHAGHVPSRYEADRARDSQFELADFLFNRLTSRRKSYPITAGMLVTEPGFRRRNAWTATAKAAVLKADLSAVRDFADWRARLMSARFS